MRIINLFTSFLPWVALSVLASLYPPLAIPAGLIFSLFNYPKLLKGFILDWATLLFFAAVFIDYQIFKDRWLVQHMSTIATFYFVAISGISLLIHQPFTLQYAKLEVEKKLWNSPVFFRVNQIMTGVLGIIFLFMALANLYRTYFNPSLNQWIIWGAGIAAQILFIDRFPKWYRKRFHHQK
jgi:hypothetical protein